MRNSSLVRGRNPGWHALPVRAAVLWASLALMACGGDGTGPGVGVPVTIAPTAAAVAMGGTIQLVATPEARCEGGVVWRSSNPRVASVNANGVVTGVAVGPAVTITANCGGPNGSALIAVTAFAPTAIMLNQLSAQIASSLAENQSSLPRNTRWADQINAKIALLQRSGLANAILAGGWYRETSTPTRAGTTPIAVVFPADTMRAGAEAALAELRPAPAILEDFFDRALPASAIRVWYGFQIGNMGGGGTIWTEDQGTYDARRAVLPTMLPFAPVLHHELGHSFIGNEALTQFLEVYCYGVAHTGSTDLRTWTYTRGYSGMSDGNTGVLAVLDIYALIGRDATARAYRALYTLSPPYGQPLSGEAQQAFVEQAPASLKTQVAAKAAKI